MNILTVRAWVDPAVDAHGIPAFSLDAELFWLPLIGPTSLLLGRRLVLWLGQNDGPVMVSPDVVGAMLGVSPAICRRSLDRLRDFRLLRQIDDTVWIRRMWGRLTERQVDGLPELLRASWRLESDHLAPAHVAS